MNLQINPDGYASELIADRFQIMSSLVGGTFYLVDLTLSSSDLLVRDTKGDIIRFISIEEAKTYILSFTSHENQDTNTSSKAWKRNLNMKNATAKATRELNEARKAAKAADAQLDGETGMIPAKPAKKIAALRAAAGPAKTAGKVVDLKPAKAAAKPTPGKVVNVPKVNPGEGSGAYIRRLLMAGITVNEVILEAVHTQFPDSKAKASDISWNKGKLKKDGVTLPTKAA
jgi:hypothetical protein